MIETFLFNLFDSLAISKDDIKLDEQLIELLKDIDIIVTVSKEEVLVSATSHSSMLSTRVPRSIQIRPRRLDPEKPSLEAPLPRKRPV